MRRPDEVSVERHSELERWGDWVNYGGFVGLGFPARSQIQVAREGGFAGGGDAGGVLASDPVAERVNAAVLALSHVRPELARLVRDYYVHHCTLAKQADVRGEARTVVKEQFRSALMWLDGRLSRDRQAA